MSSRNVVGLTADNFELVKKVAANKGITMSGLMNKLIEDFDIADKSEKIILSVPSSLTKRNREGLREWLQLRMDAVLAAYYPKGKNAC